MLSYLVVFILRKFKFFNPFYIQIKIFKQWLHLSIFLWLNFVYLIYFSTNFKSNLDLRILFEVIFCHSLKCLHFFIPYVCCTNCILYSKDASFSHHFVLFIQFLFIFHLNFRYNFIGLHIYYTFITFFLPATHFKF